MVLTITIDKSKFEESFKKVLEEKLNDALNDIADYIGTEADTILRYSEEGSFDTGFLANSLVVDKETFLHKEVGYSAAYAIFIEFGTNPHSVPIDPIYNWLLRKRHDLKLKFDKNKTTILGGKTYNAGVLKIAFAIWQKIKIHGTEPHPFLRPAFINGKVRAEKFIKDAMKK